MRLAPGIVTLLVGLAFQLLSTNAHGQVITTGPDSVLVLAPGTDTTQQKQFFLSGLKNLGRPGRAAVFSAVLPGLGQAYNKAYWKIPIIYATGAVLGYFIIDNNNRYQDFRQAVIQRRDSTDNYLNHPVYGIQRPNNVGTSSLRLSRDFYRRNRDLTIILSVVAYTLNIAEAYVHAHLREFDVSENLSLRVQPDLFQLPASRGMTPGLTLTLYPKVK